MNIKITKRERIYTQYNDMVANEYWLVYGKVYNQDKTISRSFKLVVMLDLFDVMEYFEKETISEKDKKEYVDIITESYTSYINSFEDMKEFYSVCNETIINYNNFMKRIKPSYVW